MSVIILTLECYDLYWAWTSKRELREFLLQTSTDLHCCQVIISYSLGGAAPEWHSIFRITRCVWEEKDVMIYNIMVMVLIRFSGCFHVVSTCSLSCFNFMAWTLQAIGSFESNLLNCLTPFGHRTKRLAILGDELRIFKTQHLKMSMKSYVESCLMCHRIKQSQWVPGGLWGIPLGVNSILIGGFFIMGPPLQEPREKAVEQHFHQQISNIFRSFCLQIVRDFV